MTLTVSLTVAAFGASGAPRTMDILPGGQDLASGQTGYPAVTDLGSRCLRSPVDTLPVVEQWRSG